MTNKTTKNRSHVPLFVALAFVLGTLACGSLTAKQAESPNPAATPIPATAAPSATPEAQAQAPAPTKPPAPEPTAAPAPTRQTVFQIGDVISIGNLKMTVLGWDSPAGDKFNKPDPGQKFVAVELLLRNQSQNDTAMSSLLQTSLQDSNGQEYRYDPVANLAAGASNPDGEIGPGERVRGKIGFQVPQDAQGLVFVFHDALFGAESITVELGPQPVAVDVPAELAAEPGQTMLALGDSMEIAGLTLTVNDITPMPEFRGNKPDAGKTFMVVDTTIENRGTEPVGISTVLKLYLLQMYLKDSTGQKYDLDLTASIDAAKEISDSEIAPGTKINGQVAFQVPKGAHSLIFVLDASALGYGKILVALPD
ncbi:MAG: DUF4352 domain-containing protein [Chloroflexi bacterium]|nr:DUF4352 domain-containing protein [Chloroflexota bacterium]